MKNKWIYFVSGFLCAGVFSAVIAAVVDVPVGIDPLYNPDGSSVTDSSANSAIAVTPATLPNAENVDLFVIISKGGKVTFASPDEKGLREFDIGADRPILIKKYLPNIDIKTLDTITIFSGSPSCVTHDSQLVCR